ncbi:MAG: DEAD/DEAH box helicase, partial [Dehalococcoidia bacterium]|nr:DEAD/DEAH box helicase [Dehalococcoidia bacterium]
MGHITSYAFGGQVEVSLPSKISVEVYFGNNIAPNFFAWRTTPPRAAQTHPFPTDLPAPLRETLSSRNIHSLYSHQLSAWTQVRAGKNIILATGTASGKTLSYNLPVLSALIANNDSRALYLFPTKALAQDQ